MVGSSNAKIAGVFCNGSIMPPEELSPNRDSGIFLSVVRKLGVFR